MDYSTLVRHAPLWLALLAILIYASGLGGGFVYDDEQILVESPHVVTAGLRQAFISDFWGFPPRGWRSQHYRPLSMLAYAGVYRVAGLSPFAFHAADILLHAAAVIAFYFLVAGLGFGAKRTGARAASGNNRGNAAQVGSGRAPLFAFPQDIATAAALLFAVHPLHVEAVAWMTGMTETLAGAAVLGSLALFVRGRRGPSLGLAAAALLSKETALVLPALVFLLASPRGRWKAAWPHALLAAGYLAARAVILPGPPWGALLKSLLGGGLHMPAVAAHYVRALWVPWPLAVHYELPGMWSLAAAAALLVALGWWCRKDRRMALAAGLALFPLVIPVVTSALMQEFLKIQDRYAYLATAGACLAAALLLARLPGRGLLYGCLLLVSLGALATNRQIGVWQDNETLWTHTLVVTPSSKPAALNLGYTLYLEKRFREAARVYREALVYHPGDGELTRCLSLVQR